MVRNAVSGALAGLLLSGCGQIGVAENSATSRPGPAPLPAPRLYRSADKNLTFPTPDGAFYCPLPKGWVGSDHGTVVFLTSPRRCDNGGGVASSDRGALNAPNVQVYYGYDVLEGNEKAAPDHCNEIGRTHFLGADRPLCVSRPDPDVVEVRAQAFYMAEGAEQDIKAEAVFTLVTDSGRLRTDLEVFKELLGETRTCNRADVEQPSYPNDRPSCAADAVWF